LEQSAKGCSPWHFFLVFLFVSLTSFACDGLCCSCRLLHLRPMAMRFLVFLD
jgi:hypothetical protein